jgi:hypothetical protein
MLRTIFGEPRKREEGLLLNTNDAIKEFNNQLRKKHRINLVDSKWARLDLWAAGLMRALDEFEQSVYCCAKFAMLIHSAYEDEMSPDELDNYHRHIFFYKDAFIRLFSLLDKTGFFLDLLYELETGKVKQRFSYFTVLRQLHKTNVHPQLEKQLFDLKVKYREPLDRLRKKRNLEIHSLNSELIDDNLRLSLSFSERMKIEPIQSHMADLHQAMEAACQSLHIIFRYSRGVIK